MCEGAIEGVVELSFFSCYFSSCLLGLMCLLYLFPSKLFVGPKVVVLSCGVVLYNLFSSCLELGCTDPYVSYIVKPASLRVATWADSLAYARRYCTCILLRACSSDKRMVWPQ